MWIITAALCTAGVWFAAPFSWRKWSEHQLAVRCREQRAIVLTYDDGPGERLTEALMSLLRDHEAKATFFVLGSRLKARPEIARHLLAEGHEIGGHTMRHLNAWKSDPISVARDVSDDSDRWRRPERAVGLMLMILQGQCPRCVIDLKPMPNLLMVVLCLQLQT